MKNVALLVSDLVHAKRVYAQLEGVVSVSLVIIENPVSKWGIVKRRFRRFGFLHTLGQVLTIVLVVPILKLLSAQRLQELSIASKEKEFPQNVCHRARSVNDEEVRSLLVEKGVDLVVVYGTRLISSKLLSVVQKPFINIHAGITPQFRGGHGAYWALAEGVPELAGVTVHKIDTGIDTGEVISQQGIVITKNDTFVTYPLLQEQLGIFLLKECLENKKQYTVDVPVVFKDRLYAHPAIWEYIYNLLFKGVR